MTNGDDAQRRARRSSEAPPRSTAWRIVLWRVAALGALTAIVCLPIYGLRFAGSVAVGAALSVGNLWLIARGVSASFSSGASSGWAGAFVLKFSVVIAGLYLLFDSGLVQGVPLLIGLAALPVGILISQISSAGSLREG